MIELKEINDKLDTIIEQNEQLAEQQARLEEAVANLSLPGPNYGVERYDEGDDY